MTKIELTREEARTLARALADYQLRVLLVGCPDRSIPEEEERRRAQSICLRLRRNGNGNVGHELQRQSAS